MADAIFVCFVQISMISVMRWTATVPDVQSLSAAVLWELSWDQTGRRAWVRQAGREEEINCAEGRDKPEDTENR